MVNIRRSNRRSHFYSTGEAARELGISRIAVFRRIQRGQLQAERVGRNYIIPASALFERQPRQLTEHGKREIQVAVRKVVKDFSATLQLLGKE